MRAELSRKLGELPDQPGIYIFKSAAGEALYVGKAKSLRRRATAYRKPSDDPRIALMLHDAADVEFVVTDSEAEALLFENNWIKRRQPRFNIRLRDDKTYPYLKLTLADGHPRLAFTPPHPPRRGGVLRALPAGGTGAQGNQADPGSCSASGSAGSTSTAACRGPASTTT